MRFRELAFAIVFGALAASLPASQALGWDRTLDGTEDGFWDARALLLCRIEDDGVGGTTRVMVWAALASDTPMEGSLCVNTAALVQVWGALREAKLSKGDFAVLCVKRTENGWVLTPEGLSFMPSHCGVLTLRGLGDLELATLIRKTFLIRAEYREAQARAEERKLREEQARKQEEERRRQFAAETDRLWQEESDRIVSEYRAAHPKPVPQGATEVAPRQQMPPADGASKSRNPPKTLPTSRPGERADE